MSTTKVFDTIIIGGSYAGLSAAMSLGRALRKVLIVDNGKPCNAQTPYSHNLITHDGDAPATIAAQALEQVLKYDTVTLKRALATEATRLDGGTFSVTTNTKETFRTKKLIFATGVVDEMPAIKGFADCWGISILHCPYCHGYEVKGLPTGIFANGETAFELAKLINNWTDKLTVYTNGESTIDTEKAKKLIAKGIDIVTKQIATFEHKNGVLKELRFTDGSNSQISAMYARPATKQHCDLPKQLGCAHTEAGYIEIDEFQKTTMPGIYAAGDNTMQFRSVAIVIAAGTKTGAVVNMELINEQF